MSIFLNSNKYFKYHQAGHWGKECPSSTVNTLEGGLRSLLPYDSPEKDTNSSTSFMAMLSNLGRCFRCHHPGHWAKDCPFSVGIKSRGGEGPLSFANGNSEKDVSATTSCISMSSNSDQYGKSHQLGNNAEDCSSLIGIDARGELVSSDDLEKDTNSSTSNTDAVLISDKCSISNQPRHFVKDYHSTIGINAKGEGPVSSVISDTREKESEALSTAHSANDANSTTNMTMLPNKDKCFKPFQQGHWAKECPSSNGNNDGGGEAVSSLTYGIFEKDVSSSSSSNSTPSKSDKCFKCQQPGHWAKDCPSRDSNSYNCFICNQLGHWAKDCPSRHSNSRGQPNYLSGCNIPQKVCNFCRGPCAIFTSNTANNPGRKFYKCPKCGFFEWCDGCDGQTFPSKDDNSPQRVERQQFTSPTNTSGSFTRIVKGYELSTRCPCGAGPCPVLTAQTKKNMGRQFVCCPVRKGEGSCGFFKWCEQLDSAASSVSSVTSSK